MEDKLKKLIRDLPALEPQAGSVEKVVLRIARKEMRALWEKRISIVSAGSSLLLGVLVVRQTVKVSRMLGTTGFWELLVSDFSWWSESPSAVWAAFLEANPLKEIGLVIFLLAVLAFSLYIFFKADE